MFTQKSHFLITCGDRRAFCWEQKKKKKNMLVTVKKGHNNAVMWQTPQPYCHHDKTAAEWQSRFRAGGARSEIQLRFSVTEPHLSLCKMNISCIIKWSRMALQQETRATALSSSSHLLALPPSVSYSSWFLLSICLFFSALLCWMSECRQSQNM